MAVRPILKMGDSRLLRVAKEVPQSWFGSEKLLSLISDMYETLYDAQGAGLAAPQIGVNYRVVIFGYDENNTYPDAPDIPSTVLINPKIQPVAAEFDEDWEGCLSIPGMRGLVPRYAKVRYEGFDQNGNKISREVGDFHARVVQHECDHLDGIMYPFRMNDLDFFGFAEGFDNEPEDIDDGI